MALDYKSKYKEMRMKLLESTDMAYRLGYEAGMREAQTQAMGQQLEQANAQMMQAQQGMQMDENGNPIDPSMQDPNAQVMQDPSMQGQEASPEQMSELDRHINELEQLVAKGQKPTVMDLRKTVNELSNLRKSQKTKVKENVEEIASSQKKLVDGILSKWEKEAKMTSQNIEHVISTQGLKL